MKESVAAFERRTGAAYRPPAELSAIARPLGRRQACPTLFRHPGPRALLELLRGGLLRLAPPDRRAVWLAEAADATDRKPALTFGAVAVLQPLRLSPCRLEGAAWLAPNRPLDGASALAWVPPSAVRVPVDWDRIAEPEQAAAACGPRLTAERRRVEARLSAYLEELSALRAAGAPGPGRPWLEVPAAERRRVLERHGVRPTWTRAP